jgi:cytochrome c peroxidase
MVPLLSVLTFSPAFAGNLEPLGPVPVPADNPQTTEKIELGKQLFFDRRLSGDGTMSCATCHDPQQGYSDGLAISLSYPTTRNWRNSPTLWNIGYQRSLFHDGRSRTLEEQALFPMMSAFEMNQNLDFVEEEVRSVPAYVESFRQVFGGDVTRQRMAMAIASFQRTLVSVDAPLDRYLRGEKKALSAEARKGLELFRGKARCAECHDGMLLADGKFFALNVPENEAQEKDPRVAATRRFVAKVSGYDDYLHLTEDPGRYLVTKDKKDWKAFRTPTLREVAVTGPYMHNGIFETLDEVIEFFDRGGGAGNTVLKPLNLKPSEKQALKTFLTEALTGKEQQFSYPKVP